MSAAGWRSRGSPTFGLGTGDLVPLAAAARQASSMKANPVPLTEEELVGIITSAMM